MTLRISLGLVLALLAPGGLRGQDAPAAPRAQRDARLAEILEGLREQNGLPALGAARVDGGVVTALAVRGRRAQDLADVPATAADLWHLGSCTKAMTATLVGRLVDRGLLTFDTTLAAGFPGLGERLHAGLRDVTVRQLLAHRGGITNDRAKIPALAEILARPGTPRERRRAVAEALLTAPPAHAPGVSFVYSNFGYVLVGALLEDLRDTAFEDLLVSEVGTPLGLSTLGFGAPGPAEPVTQPRGHRRNLLGALTSIPAGPDADNPAFFGPAGTAHASLEDWAKFVSAHLRPRPEGFLTKETLAALHQPIGGQEYALGWGVAERAWGGGPVLTHSGSNTYWFAVVWAAPAKDLALLAVTNCAGGKAGPALDQAVTALLRDPILAAPK